MLEERELRFDIREDVKRIDDMTDEETKQVCKQALNILSKLARAVDDYVEWY